MVVGARRESYLPPHNRGWCNPEAVCGFKSLPSSRVLQGRWYDDIDAALQAIEQVHGKLVWAPDATDEWIKQKKPPPTIDSANSAK